LPEQKPFRSWRHAVQFSIAGDVRFLSHHDTLRLFRRAATRAGLPLRYSAGFNPNPKLALPVPRPVGATGLEEWLLLQLQRPVEPAVVCEALGGQVPEGVRMARCRLSPPDASWQAREAVYEVLLAAEAAASLPPAIERAMASASAVRTRPMGPGRPAKAIDVRPFVLGLQVHDRRLTMRLSYQQGATVRPSEVLDMLGLPSRPYASCVTRVRIRWASSDLSDEQVSSSHSRPEEAGSYE
jgi:radical SAM-linked protein